MRAQNLSPWMLGLVLTVFAVPANGQLVIPGTIDLSSPQMPVIFITTPNCTGQGVTPVLYASHPFVVTLDGTYHVEVLSDAGFASIYLFEATFDPNNGFPTCIAGDNSGNPVELDEPLLAGVQYFAVPFDDTFAQVGGNYTLTLSGPGGIFPGGGAPVVAIPTLSQWGLGALAVLLAVGGFLALRRRLRAV